MKTIGGLLILVVVIAMAAYFVSDPFKGWIDSSWKQQTEWTPERIVDNPKSYLDWSENKMLAIKKQLKAQEIRISQSEASLKGARGKAQSKVDAGGVALTELKDMYREGTWPAVWRGLDRTEDWTKTQIVSLYNQIETQEKLIYLCNTKLEECSTNRSLVRAEFVNVDSALQEIRVARDTISIENISEDVKGELMKIRATVDSLASTSLPDADDPININDLAKQASSYVDPVEFDAIMKE